MRTIWIIALLAGTLFGQTFSRRIDPGPGNALHQSIADRIVVQHRIGLDSNIAERTFRSHGLSAISHHAGSGMTVLRVDPGKRDQVIKHLEATGLFNFVEPDYTAQVEMVPSDPGFGSQWHLNTIQAPSAWNTTTGSTTPIAMVDSGVDSTHPDLASKIVAGWNFVSGNSTIVDTMGHGTTTAGAVGAIGDNAVGVAGVTWKNPIMPLIVVDSTGYAPYSSIANAIMYAADHGARIVNVSIGGSSASSTLQNAVNYAWNKNTVVFASSGNGGLNAPYYPAGCQNVVAVGATDSNDVLASWSNYGTFLGLTAPGVNIYTTANGGGYTYMSGTSYSSPIAAGVAALVLAQNPSLSASALVKLLESNSDDLGVTGFDQYYGYGRVNAYRAVTAAGSAPAPPQPPVTTISTPTTGSSVQGSVNVQGTVTASAGISQIQFLVDGNPAGTAYTSPYSFPWNTTTAANGTHTLIVRGYDTASNMSQTSVSVNVSNPVAADTQPPYVYIQSPVNGSKMGNGNQTITAIASDNVKVVQVAIYLDGVQYYSGSTAPYSFSVNAQKLRSGWHTLTARAWDGSGNTSTSAAVTFLR